MLVAVERSQRHRQVQKRERWARDVKCCKMKLGAVITLMVRWFMVFRRTIVIRAVFMRTVLMSFLISDVSENFVRQLGVRHSVRRRHQRAVHRKHDANQSYKKFAHDPNLAHNTLIEN